MGLGTNHQTTTSHAIFIPEIWAKHSQRAKEKALHLANFVYRRDDEVSAFGDVLHTETISNLSANDKAINTQVTLQTPSESDVDLTINKHKEASFLIEDNLSQKAMLNLMREYVGKGSYGVGAQVDTDLFALYSSLTTTDVGTAGSALTQSTVASAWETLSTADVPEEDRCWFFHPSAYADLLLISAFTSIDFKEAVGQVAKSGMNGLVVGYMYGSPVKISTNVPATTEGSPAVASRANLYLHKEAFQLGMQKENRIQSDYILEYLGFLTVIDAIYGVATYRADHGVQVLN
jgi:hypothetical protein